MDSNSAVPRPLILLAEDDEGIRTIIQRILERAGYDVLAAKDAREALAVAERHSGSIRLLMSDLHMPGMTGDDLARRLEGRIPGLKVVLMSGSREHLAHSLNGWTVLPKPFDPGTLLNIVRDALPPASADGL